MEPKGREGGGPGSLKHQVCGYEVILRLVLSGCAKYGASAGIRTWTFPGGVGYTINSVSSQ